MEFTMNFIPLCLVANIFNLLKFSDALPPDPCFGTLNRSDCERPPRPVFTYYRPGSRCEIELWRGCPTLNKFDNEFECSYVCIGRFQPDGVIWARSNFDEDNEIEELEQCKQSINLQDCGVKEKKVYTFDLDTGKCEDVGWKGCKSENHFKDKKSCTAACKHLMKRKHSDWKQESEDYQYSESGTKGSSSQTEDSAETMKENDREDQKKLSNDEDKTEEMDEEKKEGKDKKKIEGEDKEKKDVDDEKKTEREDQEKTEGEGKEKTEGEGEEKKNGEDEKKKEENEEKKEGADTEKKEDEDTADGDPEETAVQRRSKRNKNVSKVLRDEERSVKRKQRRSGKRGKK